MNATRTHRRTPYALRYPGAADRSYYLDRLAETALRTASCVGVVTLLLYLLTSF